MSNFWSWLLAAILAASAAMAQFDARWNPPPVETQAVSEPQTQMVHAQPFEQTHECLSDGFCGGWGYATSVPQWIDACGVLHTDPMPNLALTPWYCEPPSTPVPVAYP